MGELDSVCINPMYMKAPGAWLERATPINRNKRKFMHFILDRAGDAQIPDLLQDFLDPVVELALGVLVACFGV